MNYFNLLLLIVPCVFQPSTCITNGSPAGTVDMTYVASIRDRKTDERKFGSGHLCGGALVNSQTVLTAASCVVEQSCDRIFPPISIIVTGGSTRLYQNTGHFISNVDIIQVHPECNKSTHANDLAMLILSTKVPEMHFFKPAPLSSILYTNTLLHNASCTIAGFGVTNIVNYNSTVLSPDAQIIHDAFVEIPILHHEPSFPNHSLCIRRRTKGGPCYGDYGGPVFSGRLLVGILSTPIFKSYKCDMQEYPMMAVNVSHYLEWISESIPPIASNEGAQCLIVIGDILLIAAALTVHQISLI